MIDEIQSFKKKKEWLVSRLSQRGEEIRRNLGLVDSLGQTLYHVNKINVNRYTKREREKNKSFFKKIYDNYNYKYMYHL